MPNGLRYRTSALCLAGAIALVGVRGWAQEELLSTGGRSRYVHRISLYDEQGQAISSDDRPARAWSPSRTCGKCHPYRTVASGWHFNAWRGETDPGRPGEPWILSDAATGTQLPLSARSWPGLWRPEQAGLDSMDFLMRFGRHLPGGGPGEPTDQEKNAPGSRWNVTGGLEIDCLVCHDGGARHDPAIAERQVAEQNFRWAATAASGVATVRGSTRNLPEDWDPEAPPNPDYPGSAGPEVIHDKSRFDADDRVFFDLTSAVSPERCYYCHTTRPSGSAATERWRTDDDIHITAGLKCVDCHRNGLDHAIVRGYEGEAASSRPETRTLSCEGCHRATAEASVSTDTLALGGRLRAPRPRHAGMPLVHFERMACTACHSGAWPQAETGRAQTSMAHGLGLSERGRRSSALPMIQEPVYMKGADGRLAPHRLLWPAFWGRQEADGTIEPLPFKDVTGVARPVLTERFRATQADKPLAAGEVAAMLKALQLRSRDQWTPVYVAAGQAHRLNREGVLEAVEDPVATPYGWPVAHTVRPAAQSIGARGCTDCHASDAPYFFGRVAALAPMEQPQPRTMAMWFFEGLDGRMQRLWGWSFIFRPFYKYAGFGLAGLAGIILAAHGLAAVRRWTRGISGVDE